MNNATIFKNLDFEKGNGLIPAVIQDAQTKQVLMLGYMNSEALEQTQREGKVTFYSRTKKRLWTKGETSKNFLRVVSIKADCDNDTLLILVNPDGPTCHTGDATCWGEDNNTNPFFLTYLENLISERKNNPNDESYTAALFARGINKIAQKVGEEAVELVIEAKDNNKELFLNEAADLLYHFQVLLAEKEYKLSEVLDILRERNNE